jgi:predicted nucleotidyltransferase
MKKRYKESVLILNSLRFFVENPYKEVYLREFGREIKISPNTAQRFLNLFLKEGFVKESRKANLRYFQANLDSISFRHIKIVFSLKELEGSGIVDYLKEKFPQVVLFGSVAKGLDDNKSDIDLVCIGIDKKLDLFEFQKKLKKEISVHVFSMSEWKKQKEKNRAFYQEVISLGINLIGEIPIID